jgi:hypothetical protein
MDEIGMKLWLQEVWLKCPGHLLALLVCDQFTSQITETTERAVKEINTQTAVIPGVNCKPWNVSINKLFIEFTCEEWTKWMDSTTHDLTPIGQMMQTSTGNHLSTPLKYIEIPVQGISCLICPSQENSAPH